MAKLDESQVRWIVRQRRKRTPVAEVAEAMHISPSWVKSLASRYRGIPIDKIVYPYTMGRPRGGLPGRREHSLVISAYYAHMEGATLLAASIEESTGVRIPHHVVHAVLKENGLARTERGKAGPRKTARYVKRYSNTMWHTDYKLLPDGRWLVSYQDDASRRIMAWGIFERATAANAIEVLDGAIAEHGAPLSILSDHGSTFCDNESGGRRKGEGQFERYLKERGIRHIKARVGHPQTNGKLERVHGEMERKLPLFMEASAARTTRSGGGGGGGGGGDDDTAHVGGPFHTAAATDPVDRFVEWFNNERPNMALDTSIRETPAQAYRRKMPKPGDGVQRDLEMSGAYARQSGVTTFCTRQRRAAGPARGAREKMGRMRSHSRRRGGHGALESPLSSRTGAPDFTCPCRNRGREPAPAGLCRPAAALPPHPGRRPLKPRRHEKKGIALLALVQRLYGGLHVGVRGGDLDPFAVDVDDVLDILASSVSHANGAPSPAY